MSNVLHTVIAELADMYDNLNERWGNDTCATDVYQVYRQKEYTGYSDKLSSIQ